MADGNGKWTGNSDYHRPLAISHQPSAMTRVLVLATTTGYQTRAFGDAAERLGVELVFATDRCDVIADPWQDAAIPIRFYDEDRSVTGLLDAVRFQPIDGQIGRASCRERGQ